MSIAKQAQRVFAQQFEWHKRFYKKDGVSPPGHYIKLTIEEYPRWLGNNIATAIETLKIIAGDYIDGDEVAFNN